MGNNAVDCIWPLGTLLGEGPVWDVNAGRLQLVDIERGEIHSCDALGGARLTVVVGGNPSFLFPTDNGDFIVGNRDRLLRFDGQAITGEFAHIAMPASNRFNDATVDGHGRLWFGSMDKSKTQPSGALRLISQMKISVVGGGFVVTNGPALSTNGRILYLVDTLNRAIWQFDVFDGDRLENGELFARIEDTAGTPDGCTIDAEDHLWVCLWGGWAARRYDPNGRLVQEVRFPCANVTKIAFGGPDFRIAFATSARAGLSTGDLSKQPLAGGVFAFAVDVPGTAVTPVRLSK